MRWNFVLSSFVVSMLSVNAFALDTHAAQVISQKEWTTGNIKGSFKDATLDPKIQSILTLHRSAAKSKQGLFGNAQIDWNKNVVEMDSYLFDDFYGDSVHRNSVGYTPIYMENRTNAEHTYKVETWLCVSDYSNFSVSAADGLGCINTESIVRVSPHQESYFVPYLTATYNVEAGHSYLTHVSSFVSVDNDDVTIFETSKRKVVSADQQAVRK